MSDVAYIARSKDAVLRVYYDEDCENPRDWDNIGTMVCWHRNYTLGDKHRYSTPRSFLVDLAGDLLPEAEQQELFRKNFKDFDEDPDYYELEDLPMDDLLEAIKRHAVVLPVYMYEHSAIRLSTGDFGDPWDSGQVGWIYATHQTVIREYGDASAESLAKTEKYLKGEVETQSDYVNGQCFYYALHTRDGEGDDNCSGFIGSDFSTNGMRDQIESKYAALVDELEPIYGWNDPDESLDFTDDEEEEEEAGGEDC